MSNEEKSKAAQLKEQLFMNRKNGCRKVSADEIVKADEFCEEYKNFLDNAKIEREAVSYSIEAAKNAGFEEYDYNKNYAPGDKVYVNNRGKAIMLAVIGKNGTHNGVRLGIAHIDSPRLDLKPNPLYEANNLALFKTHYYGGIKKYQWPTVPLSLHGVIALKDGTNVSVQMGEDDAEPCFCVTDLLPHLAVDQMSQVMTKAFNGEHLNVLVGSRPFNEDEESESVKLNVLNLLFEKYGLMAALDTELPESTVITVLTDREEIGSDGNTGMKSTYLVDFIADLAKADGEETRHVMAKTTCLSADVNAAFDPTYSSAFEANNSSYINNGAVITKYTGSGGKYSTSDASAEYMAKIRKILDDAGVLWQTGELGKVDGGGGGTIAKFVANYNADVVDLGVPVLSMHAPMEVVSKLDVYMTYRALYEFYMA